MMAIRKMSHNIDTAVPGTFTSPSLASGNPQILQPVGRSDGGGVIRKPPLGRDLKQGRS